VFLIGDTTLLAKAGVVVVILGVGLIVLFVAFAISFWPRRRKVSTNRAQSPPAEPPPPNPFGEDP
jgi:hypothetical protein